MPSMILSRRVKIALSVVAALVVLLIVFVQLTGVYINYLWYGSLGHRNVYSTVLWTKVSLFFIFGALMALIIGGNLVVAYMVRPPFRPMSSEQQNLQNYALMIEPRRKLILIVVSLITFLAAGASAEGSWGMWQLWLHGGSFGAKDPLFGLDISFYAWDYPVYRSLLGFGFSAIIVSLILSLVVHYLTGAIRLQTPGPKMTIAARRHITILVFVFMALKAVAYWLDRYGLVFSTRSSFTGASYTDVHSVLPAKTILFWISIVLAIGVLASLWLRSALLPGIGFIVLLVLSILIGGIYPAIVQSVSVKPNASTKEAPYIRENIQATRQAYGIVTAGHGSGGTVTYRNYPVNGNPPVAALQSHDATISNIRILDPNVLSPTFNQQQGQQKNFYGFPSRLDVDRYTVNKTTNDYIVGVRELSAARLNGDQRNWINEHTNYTHGYGFVAAAADTDVTQNAVYADGDIPQSGTLNHAVPLTQPRVYFGQLLPDYAIVGAKGARREFDGSGEQKYTYQGTGGISLSSFFTRLAFAVHYKETNFLLNNVVSAPGARIMINRDPRQMVQKVAPFLQVDSDPYPIVDSSTGHIVWMLDGYTTMADYPYSERRSLSSLTASSLTHDNQAPGQPNSQINYIRNSVKATVDAYTGKVSLYTWAPNDPVLKAWKSVFPGLVQPKSAIPPDILQHVRYPQDLFEVQRQLLEQYHVNNPVLFYNGSDRWTVPSDPSPDAVGNQPPYYVLANPQDGSSGAAQFQLTSPMKVNQKTNLASYITVDSDPGPDYGKLTVLTVGTGTVIDGPQQVENDFLSNPVISRDVGFFDSHGSSVRYGNLLTLPVGGNFLYVQPLYVQAATNGFPILRKVIVKYGDAIGYGNTLQQALDQAVNGGLQATPPGNGGTGSPNPTPPSQSSQSNSPPPSTSTPTTPPPAGSVTKVLNQLDQAYTDYANATTKQQISDSLARIIQLLNRYHQLTGQSPPASSTAAPPSPSSSSG